MGKERVGCTGRTPGSAEGSLAGALENGRSRIRFHRTRGTVTVGRASLGCEHKNVRCTHDGVYLRHRMCAWCPRGRQRVHERATDDKG